MIPGIRTSTVEPGKATCRVGEVVLLNGFGRCVLSPKMANLLNNGVDQYRGGIVPGKCRRPGTHRRAALPPASPYPSCAAPDGALSVSAWDPLACRFGSAVTVCWSRCLGGSVIAVCVAVGGRQQAERKVFLLTCASLLSYVPPGDRPLPSDGLPNDRNPSAGCSKYLPTTPPPV